MNQCFEYLAFQGYLVWRNNTGAMTDKTGRFIRFGRVGAGDLLAVKGGRFFSIEVKRPGGKPSPHQIQWKQDVEDHGAVALIVYSVEELIQQLSLKLK